MDKALSPAPPTADWASEWPPAVEAGDASGVESLLASGAPVDATFERGETALMRASARGYADVARVLLAAGANVDARREDGFTPLILAVFFGHEEVVRLLLEAGADTSARTALGTTAAKWAASRGFGEIVELLKEAEASRPARAPEPGGRTRVEAEDVPPAVTPTFEPRESPSEPRVSFAERKDAPVERRASPVEHRDSKAQTAGHRDLKTQMEVIVAAPSVIASSEPDAAAASAREGATFINNSAGEGATVERPRAEEFSSSAFVAPDESATRATAKVPALSSAPRFRSVLQSWPVTAGALVLIVASSVSVVLLWRGADFSSARPNAPAAGQATQPVVPQTPPQAGETLPQPSPSVTPEVMQPLPAAPGTYDSFPFTPSPQEVIVSGPPSTPGAASNVPAVVSESGGGSGSRAAEGDATRGRASDADAREATPAPAAPTRAAREGEGVVEGTAVGTTPRGPQPRAGVETRRTATQPQPPSPVNTPAPTPAERRKVIQWP